MSLPRSHPASAPVLDPHSIRPAASRELHLLQRRAETYRADLELESHLRSQGIATLPLVWIEHQRQMILDKIQWMESREDDFTSSFNTAHDPAPTLPIWGHNGSITALPPSISPISVHPFVLEADVCLPPHAGSTIFDEDESLSQHHDDAYHDSASRTVHGHADAPVSPDERIRRSPAIAMGPLPVDHENTQRDSPRRTTSTHRGMDLGQVERLHYHQPHVGMFNGAQSITISGGVFNVIQGNVSSMADDMLAPE